MRVIKLGGSLLGMPSLTERFERWYQQQSPMTSIVVVGGGAAADVLREIDRSSQLDASAAHWLAIRAMQLNARIVQEIMPGAVWFESFDQIAASGLEARVLIADPWKLMQEAAASDRLSLPESWDVTSDSISAWLTAELAATELVLLKSTLPPRDATVQMASACGYVDAYFTKASAPIARIRCINMRDGSSEANVLKGTPVEEVAYRDS